MRSFRDALETLGICVVCTAVLVTIGLPKMFGEKVRSTDAKVIPPAVEVVSKNQASAPAAGCDPLLMQDAVLMQDPSAIDTGAAVPAVCPNVAVEHHLFPPQ